MKLRIAMVLLGMTFLASGCRLHPPYGVLNDNTTFIPPLSKLTHRNNLPPANMLMEPGPGVGGPGPGIITPPEMGPMGGGVVPCSACGPGGPGGPCGPGGPGMGGMMPGMGGMMPGMPGMGGMATSQVAFSSPDGMAVSWDIGGMGAFDSEPLIVPARYNFPIGAIYRLKLTNIPGRPGVELYPTLEIGPPTPRTEAYLAHNAIPAQFTEEDLDQVLSGNFVTKVVYLPDPEFQELAIAGVETLVSTRLDPGFDPIVEADRRGAILAIIRVGNKDLEAAGGEAELAGMGGYGGAMCGPGGSPCVPGITGAMPAGTPAAFIAGMTAPEYGMPTCGTPIGLPGPAHIPLGVPAGLQKHVMKNHTKMHIPSPVRRFKVDVREKPGFSYPEPVRNVRITEHKHMPPVLFHQPIGDKHDFDYDVPDATDCQ
jgi:hypothetical protein